MLLQSGLRKCSRLASLSLKYTRCTHCSCMQLRTYQNPSNGDGKRHVSFTNNSKYSKSQSDIIREGMFCSSFTRNQTLFGIAVEPYLPRQYITRAFHASSSILDKSKVEDSLKAKTKKKSETEHDPLAAIAPKPPKSIAEKLEPKKPLWDRVVAEVKHYYHGFRLLALDVRIASKTLWKTLRGKPVSRRERNQFRRALSDIFRLAPFSIFIIIPFAELALPIAVKLFPNFLPSTFEDKNARDTRLRKELAVKLQMAKFMQDTVEEIAMRSKKSSKSNTATEDFAKFFEKIRTSDDDPTNEDILKHAKLFEDELTLDSMTRPQLIALCRLIQVPAVGSNNLLRFLLQMKLKRLHDDDTMIQKEGIESLTVQELQTACQARGMRALGMSTERLKHQLAQWIDLHLNHDVPSSLLLLSRVLFMPENVPVEKMVKEAISALPEKVADEAEVRAAEINCERIDNTKRYKITKQEQIEIAKEEADERQKEIEKKLLQKKKKQAIDAVQKDSSESTETHIVLDGAGKKIKESIEHDTMRDIAMAEEFRDEGPILKDEAPVLKEEITKEEIDALDKVIGNITKEKEESLSRTKSELEDLREDLVEYQQDVINLDRNLSSEEDEMLMKEKKASSRLQKSIARFIGKMDKIVAELEKQKRERPDGDLSDEGISISVEDLKTSLRGLGELSEDKLSAIAHLLDSNKDGSINLEEAIAAIEVLDSEDVSVTADQLGQLVGLLESKDKAKREETA